MVDQTLSFYAQNAETYAARSVVNPKLAEFLHHVAPGGFILELGSGSGLDAKFMIENGFKVDPTDGSYELAEEASRLLGQPVRHMYFEDLDAIEQYDGIYASASLLHAKRSVLPEIVKCIHRALKTSGSLGKLQGWFQRRLRPVGALLQLYASGGACLPLEELCSMGRSVIFKLAGERI